MTIHKILQGVVIDDEYSLSISEFSQMLNISSVRVIEFVEHAIVIPRGTNEDNWLFDSNCSKCAKIAIRLQSDLEVNTPGAALALDLLQRIDVLEKELFRLKS